VAVIYLLIAFSVVIAVLFLGAFIWASKSGQFDDAYTPSVRILFDDAVSEKPKTEKDGDREV
jgi:cbb3-type cytochrome oxidase maturation protein